MNSVHYTAHRRWPDQRTYGALYAAHSCAMICRKTHLLPFSPVSSGPSGAAKGGINYLQKRYLSTRDTLPPIIYTVPREHLETITGNMLGDGSIRPGSVTRDGVVTGNARYGMTMMASSKDYLIFIRENTRSCEQDLPLAGSSYIWLFQTI